MRNPATNLKVRRDMLHTKCRETVSSLVTCADMMVLSRRKWNGLDKSDALTFMESNGVVPASCPGGGDGNDEVARPLWRETQGTGAGLNAKLAVVVGSVRVFLSI
jgi:hypothetical protein